jgi:hypothetical protein
MNNQAGQIIINGMVYTFTNISQLIEIFNQLKGN